MNLGDPTDVLLDPVGGEPRRDFGDDPWRLVVLGIDPALAAQDETIFSLGNGYLGFRGNHEEGLPLGSHGTYVNGLHETWRIQHAEHAYGFAEQGQTIINAPDTKTIRIYVDDERLNLSTAEVLEVRRTLDLQAGTLTRSLIWLTATGKRVRVETRRMVSLASRHLATIEMRVTVLDADAELTISSLALNRHDLGRVSGDPAQALDSAPIDPRRSEDLEERVLLAGPMQHDAGSPGLGTRSLLSYRVSNSGMGLAVGMDHDFEVRDPDGLGWDRNPEGWRTDLETGDDRVRHVFQGTARAGVTVGLTKTITYHASATAALSELIARCAHTLDSVATEPMEARWEAQRQFLDEFWQRSDVRVDAGPQVQQAIRWNLFQVAQASARADGRGIPAKGLTGSGYSGHYFWDSEIYVLPFLTYTNPQWARNALRSRQRMLPQARRRAIMLNEDGALFPWRTINGEEASAYYAAGTAQYHINADITFALARYTAATGDLEFLINGACDLVIETARLWNTLGFWRTDPDGSRRFHIHGVTGPDEYTTVVNDNLYTNVMARFNLRFAAEIVRRLAAEAPAVFAEVIERLHLDPAEPDLWEDAAEHMTIPYSESMRIHPQDAHFLDQEVWDLAATPPEQKPLLLHFHPLVIYRFQVLKQADVVLALLLASEAFTQDEKRRDFEYYDALTTGDSTLSAVVQSIIAAEVGYRDLAYWYFDNALRVDLDDLHRNSADGVHIASAGGVWMMLVQGFAGMRDAGRKLSFDPRLPAQWGSLEFALQWRGRRIDVALQPSQMTFTLNGHVGARAREPIEISVRGVSHALQPGVPCVVELSDRGPDLGRFRGLSASTLPRDGDSGFAAEMQEDVPIVTTTIPTRSPGQL